MEKQPTGSGETAIRAQIRALVSDVLLKEDKRNEGDIDLILQEVHRAYETKGEELTKDELTEIVLDLLAKREEIKQDLKNVELIEEKPGEPLQRRDEI